MSLSVEVPINSLSMGQVSVAILRELYKQGENVLIYPIGNVDLSAQTPDNNFNVWLNQGIANFQKSHNKNKRVFKLWHPNQSLSSVSKEQILLTFHESSVLTDTEINILSQQYKVLVTSQYTKQVFETFGLTNVVYCPLGFDEWNFKQVNVKPIENVVNWFVGGKLEQRKCQLKTIQLWARKYGNNPNHRLNCLIFNPFLESKQQEAVIQQVLGGQHYWNIKFNQPLKTNFEVNQLLNAIDIDLTGISHCEGFNLIPFHSLCLGKQAIFLDAHIHKDYCTSENSILVEPSGMIAANDGIWFRPGAEFSQGFWHNFKDETVVAAMEQAEKKAKTLNTKGIELREKFNYKKTVEIIKQEL